MPLTVKQQEYLRSCSHRWNIKVGATGSGKSWIDFAVVIPKRILAATGAGLLVMIGNTQATLTRNILEPMRAIWGPRLVGEIRQKDNTAVIFGKRVYILGADKATQVARIQGATIEWCYGDEMTTWSEDVFQMLKSRLRCENSTFDGTANPTFPTHWLKKFIDSDADVFCQTSTIYDNPYLPASVVAELEKEYAGTVYFDRFIRGLWRAAQGVIYGAFASKPTAFHLPEGALKKCDDPFGQLSFCTIGVDFGGNGSAHAFSCTGFTQGMAKMVLLEEYYRREIITPTQLEEDFVAFVRMCRKRYGDKRVTLCFADSAEQTLIQGLRAACIRTKLPIDIQNARKGPINDRIRFLLRLMAQGRFFIAPHCKATEAALSEAVWDDKTREKDLRLDDGQHNIDSLDALEYSFENMMEVMIAA